MYKHVIALGNLDRICVNKSHYKSYVLFYVIFCTFLSNKQFLRRLREVADLKKNSNIDLLIAFNLIKRIHKISLCLENIAEDAVPFKNHENLVQSMSKNI